MMPEGGVPEQTATVRVALPKRARDATRGERLAFYAKSLALTPAYWLLARVRGGAGLALHARSAAIGARLLRRPGALGRRSSLDYLFAPMDSVRYFELDYAWRAATLGRRLGEYLDVSSPRLLPLLLLDAHPDLRAVLLNPDVRDLDQTRRLLAAAGLDARCSFHPALIADAPFAPASFDTVTSISVLEHIPDDTAAVVAMWALVRPGGRLIISVPCAARGYEEHLDFNEYNLLAAGEDGFVFGQRFYDDAMLRARVYSVTGPPAAREVLAERRAGTLVENRAHKLRDPLYPYYREPYMMTRQFRRVASVADVPSAGVVALTFEKR